MEFGALEFGMIKNMIRRICSTVKFVFDFLDGHFIMFELVHTLIAGELIPLIGGGLLMDKAEEVLSVNVT